MRALGLPHHDSASVRVALPMSDSGSESSSISRFSIDSLSSIDTIDALTEKALVTDDQYTDSITSITTMAKAESSKAAASNGARANPNAAGGANYELPWYTVPNTIGILVVADVFPGSRSTVQSTSTMSLATPRRSSASRSSQRMATCRT